MVFEVVEDEAGMTTGIAMADQMASQDVKMVGDEEAVSRSYNGQVPQLDHLLSPLPELDRKSCSYSGRNNTEMTLTESLWSIMLRLASCLVIAIPLHGKIVLRSEAPDIGPLHCFPPGLPWSRARGGEFSESYERLHLFAIFAHRYI